jgi:hypothetical protein
MMKKERRSKDKHRPLKNKQRRHKNKQNNNDWMRRYYMRRKTKMKITDKRLKRKGR